MFRILFALFKLAVVVVLGLAVFGVWKAHRGIAELETLDPRDGAPGRFVSVGEYEMHVREWGDPSSPPLLLLHGFGAAAATELADLGARMGERFHVIAPDMLGMGRSERVLEPGAWYGIRQRAARMPRILDQLNVDEPAAVMGTSFGGAVALQLALDHPQRVRRLVLIDAQAMELGGGVFQWLGSLPLGLGTSLSYLGQGGGSVERAQADYEKSCSSGGPCPDRSQAESEWAMRKIRGTSQAFRAISASPLDARIPADLSQVGAETLVIWGSDDPWIPLEQGRRLAEAIPNARLEIIDQAGHSPYKDQPEAVVALIASFLADPN